jgi:RHS repeat-associated protein
VITDGVNGNRTSNYTYDFVGNRQTKTINGVMTTYAYDGNDRLLNEKVGSNVTATYDYDNNGSTTQKVENGVTTTYVWNDEKRLVSATVGTTQVEYVYNDQGIRVASKQNGVETRYLLDEGIVANVWEEYAPNGTVQAAYVYGNDLITQTQAGQTSYYLVDGLGSTRLLTDTQGQVLNAYGYEAFGETVSQSGATSNKYQYTGEQFDATLGDYYLRQRFYDTSSGRFGRMDTYQGQQNAPLTLHKYIYANANPVQHTDPSGYLSMGEVLTAMTGFIRIGLATVGRVALYGSTALSTVFALSSLILNGHNAFSRKLTTEERQLTFSVFHYSIIPHDVGIAPKPIIAFDTSAFVWGNTIYADNRSTYLGNSETFIHEMTHIWQFQQRGLSYAWNSINKQSEAWLKGGNRNLAYKGWEQSFDNQGFENMDTEAQAELVEEYYRAMRKGNEARMRKFEYTMNTYVRQGWGSA